MPDNLIEALRVQVFADGADAGLAGLALLELLVELLLEDADVEAGRGDRRHVLEPELALFFILVRGENRVQVVFGFGRVTWRQR